MRTKLLLSHFLDHAPFEAMLYPNDAFSSAVPNARAEFLSSVPSRFRLRDPPAFTMNPPRFENQAALFSVHVVIKVGFSFTCVNFLCYVYVM
jgi:hypothetical protein